MQDLREQVRKFRTGHQDFSLHLIRVLIAFDDFVPGKWALDFGWCMPLPAGASP